MCGIKAEPSIVSVHVICNVIIEIIVDLSNKYNMVAVVNPLNNMGSL